VFFYAYNSELNGSENPTLSVDQMKEVDRLMIEEYGIQLRQMMEDTGRSLAELAARMLGTGPTSTPRVLGLCGPETMAAAGWWWRGTCTLAECMWRLIWWG